MALCALLLKLHTTQAMSFVSARKDERSCYLLLSSRESQGGLLSKENNKKERREEATLRLLDQLSSGASPISNIFILFWPLPFIIIILPVIKA